jgi:hypothetical protein
VPANIRCTRAGSDFSFAVNFAWSKAIVPSRLSCRPATAGDPSPPTAEETALSTWLASDRSVLSPLSVAVELPAAV